MVVKLDDQIIFYFSIKRWRRSTFPPQLSAAGKRTREIAGAYSEVFSNRHVSLPPRVCTRFKIPHAGVATYHTSVSVGCRNSSPIAVAVQP